MTPPSAATPVRLIGRHDESDPSGPRFAWSGSGVEARFRSSAIAVRLAGSSDYFRVLVDGRELPPLGASPTTELYPLAAGLTPGPHRVELVKRTEPLVGETQFLGFELDEDGALLPPPAAPGRRLELIGDSVTAGFGVGGANERCKFSPETEDFTRSYAALTAAALGAEPVAIAWSGRGVVRNHADEPGDPMPVLYERTLPARPESRWDFGRWTADAVVVALGTNDFSVGRCPPARAFVEAYAGLLARVRGVYPRAAVFCGLGPMLLGAELDEARRRIEEAIALASSEASARPRLVEFPPQSAEEGYGCDGHPSARTHRRMAAQLTAAIRADVGW